MRKIIAPLALWLLISAHPAMLIAQTQTIEKKTTIPGDTQGKAVAGWADNTLSVSAGYRNDKLNWNIAGNRAGRDPNVLSELSWSGIRIYQLKLTHRTVIRDYIYLRGQLDYGWVVSGDNQDSDFSGDNRTQEFSRSVNGVDGNSVWDGSIGVGPRFALLDAAVVICPMLGYAIAEQDLNIVDGYQVLATPPIARSAGPIVGLDSRYQTRWKGPWVGLDLMLTMPFETGPLRCLEILLSGEYHWMDYSADANWNLRTDLQHPVSFSHAADGSGLMVGTTLRFRTRGPWGIDVGMQMADMTTDPGLDRVYFADGSISETRLNEVNWRSFTFEAGLSYQF